LAATELAPPSICFIWSDGGLVNAMQRGRSHDLAAGQGILLSSAEFGHVATPRGGRYNGFAVSREILSAGGFNPDDLPLLRFDPQSPSYRMLKAYTRFAQEQVAASSAEGRNLMGAHLAELACLAFRDALALPESGPNAAVAARFDLCKDYIARRGSDPELALPEIAAACGLSVRTIQMMFEAEGTTFSRFLLEMRLGRALAMLQDQALSGLRIIDIALKCGFSDVSYFNRRFRSHFGDTPKSVRP
jgi:AraC-like DNA-binding protein